MDNLLIMLLIDDIQYYLPVYLYKHFIDRKEK